MGVILFLYSAALKGFERACMAVGVVVVVVVIDVSVNPFNAAVHRHTYSTPIPSELCANWECSPERVKDRVLSGTASPNRNRS